MNTCMMTGILASEPDKKTLPSGMTVVEANVAITCGRGARRATQFTKVRGWGKTGESLAEFHKGDAVMFTAEYVVETWQTKEGRTASKHLFNLHSIEGLNDPETAAPPRTQPEADADAADSERRQGDPADRAEIPAPPAARQPAAAKPHDDLSDLPF